MSAFENISREKVVSFHKFIRVLRRLGVIGKLYTTTLSANRGVPVSAMGFVETMAREQRFTVRYDGYDESRYEMRVEMELEKLFDHRTSTDPWRNHFKF